MLSTTTTVAETEAALCPLDGAETEEFSDGFVLCVSCREILEPSETVAKATEETWGAYLVLGSTDTDPWDAPLERLHRGVVSA